MMSNIPTQISYCDTKECKKNYADENLFKTLSEENLVPISLSLSVEGRTIFDSFLWNSDNNDEYTMKQFGLQILSEKLGRTTFTELSYDSKRKFSEAIMEIIKLNLNTYNKLKCDKYIGTIFDKTTTPSSKDSKEKEQPSELKKHIQEDLNPIAKICIAVNNEKGEFIEDTFYWDVTCCLNRPEEFARKFCRDTGLSPTYEKQVSFAIRKQIFDHLKQISFNKKINVLKKYQAPINKQTNKFISFKDECRIDDQIVYGRSEYSDRELYIPNDFYQSINNYPNGEHNLMGHRNHNFAFRGMSGKCDKMVPRKIKKLDAPKNILLIVKKIYPNNDEEGSDVDSIQQSQD